MRDRERKRCPHSGSLYPVWKREDSGRESGDRAKMLLGFKTFDKAAKANPGVHPLFHSDRGFQYTNRTFHQKLDKAGMTQSMSWATWHMVARSF